MTAVEAAFQPQETSFQINKGHGRIEKRTVSISQNLTGIPDFPGLKTLIRVESERHVYRANIIESSTETRYYVTSLTETAQLLKEFEAIGGSKTKFIMSVMSRCGEDTCRIRTVGLIQSWAIARNFALNLYRDYGFQNMAQAQRLAGFSCSILKDIFRMK